MTAEAAAPLPILDEPLVLHEDVRSANCYKIRLTAAHLGIGLERRSYDILAGDTRTAAFLERVNPDGRIPVLQIGRRFLPESGAACIFLADRPPSRSPVAPRLALIPRDRFDRADMMRWMFWEQYQHEPNIATLRFWRAIIGEVGLDDVRRGQIAAKQAAGDAALALMDRHLVERRWFVGDAPSLADIVLYAYTHLAGEGGFDLARTPAVVAWLARVAALDHHLAFDA